MKRFGLSKDEELKNKILDRTFFDFTCPRCGNVMSIAAPMVYVNEEKGFIVKLAMDWDLLLNEKHNLDTCSKCPQIKRFYGATCPNDFLDKVILLEHDKEVFDCEWLLLDFKRKQIERANTILKEQGKQELFNENNVTAYFVQREDACDGICPHIVFPNGEFVEMPFAFAGLDEYMDFDYEMQNGGICDEKSIACYLKYHKYRQTPEPLTVALVKFKDNYFFATIREEENGMYKEGDEVLAVDDFTFLDCTIEKIINTNKEKFPRDMEEDLVVLPKKNTRKMITSMASNEKFDNPELLAKLKQFSSSGKYERIEGIENANVAIVYDVMLTSKRKVSVSQDFSVRITDSYNDESKSEGQFAVVSFAYIGGILKMLKSEDSLSSKEYPLVLDGPFSKLDPDQRLNVVKAIPSFAPQVILFSKDDLSNVFPVEDVGRVYTIESNAEKNVAKVKEGFLWI